MDLLPIFPSALQSLNRMLTQKQISVMDDYIMIRCIGFLQFFIENIPYEMMMMILNEDSIGLIIRFSRIYSIRRSQVLDILVLAAAKDKSGVIKDMVIRLQHSPLTFLNSKPFRRQKIMQMLDTRFRIRSKDMRNKNNEYSESYVPDTL